MHSDDEGSLSSEPSHKDIHKVVPTFFHGHLPVWIVVTLSVYLFVCLFLCLIACS